LQLIVQEPSIYDKRHTDYARQDRIDLAWEGILYEMKESGMSAKAMQTTHAV
jgi:hypothetical protein